MKRRRRRVEENACRAGTAIFDLETVEIQEADHFLAGGVPVQLQVRVL
jgi:hypothetical protein